MAKQDNTFTEEIQSTVNIRERLSQYLTNWPLFLVCIAICLIFGIVYIRYTVPRYTATTSILVNNAPSDKPSKEDLIESALNGKSEVNINNDILLISAFKMMERTVRRNNFNISYYKKGRLLNIDIYKAAPFTLVASQPSDSINVYSFYIKKINATGGTFLYGIKKSKMSYSFRWNERFTIGRYSFTLIPKKEIMEGDGEYIVNYEPVSVTAGRLSENLTVKSYDPKTSAIQLSEKTESLQKSKDILNALVNEFNSSNIEDRNRLSEKTVRFIDDRLMAISGDLRGVEGSLESYQGKKELIDIKSQSTQSLENSNDVSKAIKDLALQQGVTSMILEYFSNPSKGGKLVPSALGLNDGTLGSLITQYNDLQLKKGREAPLVAPNSTVMQDLNTQEANLKSSILESLNNIARNLALQEYSLKQQNSQYRSTIASMPHNERVLQEIKRKQGITEGLYLYLLQKREEAAISGTASNIPNYQQIDLASSYGEVEPNPANIILYTFLLGFFLAFGWIYFRNLLNNKITSGEDIAKRTSLSVLGEISHVRGKNRPLIPVLERNVAGEQFRAIRTNLYFSLKNKDQKVILITSSSSNDGKSFVSLNLAVVCAMPGKKVALLELDTRKPLDIEKGTNDNTYGLTDFLLGKVNSITEIGREFQEIPNLHVFPAGPLSLNPADLLLSENMGRLFMALKAAYDYIIIDSPPAGLVSDALILQEHSDVVLYIVRYKKTTKRQFDLVNAIAGSKTAGSMSLILNDVKKSESYDYRDTKDYKF